MTFYQWILAGSLIVYVLVMLAISVWANLRIKDSEDYVVAGRRLPLSLAWMTILATWFGAATMLTQTDEIRRNGLQKATLDPIGAGLCLLVAGAFFASRLWSMKLLTIADFFRRKHGRAAEILSGCIMIPSYFGWIATQFIALAGMLYELFGMPLDVGIFLVAAVGTACTFLGGMWSVTITDAIQITLVLVGLLVLGFVVLDQVGGGNVLVGLERILQNKTVTVDGEQVRLLRLVPDRAVPFQMWLGVLCIGMLGNIAGQDLLQRVFAAKSAGVARKACYIAGIVYLTFGMLPVLLGLASHQLLPDTTESVIAELSRMLLHPLPQTLFLLAITSAVLSTIDSAILSPAAVVSQNLLGQSAVMRRYPLLLNRIVVLCVAGSGLLLAYSGQRAYEHLEAAYEIPLVGLFVPLTLGLYLKPRGQAPAVVAMVIGGGGWLFHYGMEVALDDRRWALFLRVVPIHRAIALTLLGLCGYLILHWINRSRTGSGVTAGMR